MTLVAKIPAAISESNFETVRDQIGALLTVELTNQALLIGGGVTPDPDITSTVYIERLIPYDISENNVVYVSIMEMNLDNQNQLTQRNTVNFAIDVFCNAKEDLTTTETCKLARVKLDRLVGIILKILQSPYYNKLGLSAGIIEMRNVTKVLFSDKYEKDVRDTRMARMILNVVIHEECAQIVPVTASDYLTEVKLEESDKGYYFEYVNP